MATQKPLIISSGKIKQIAATDTIPPANIGTGTPDGTKFLRDDGTYVTPTATVADNSITNAKLAQAATMTIKGNNTAGTANVTDLTAAQILALLKANTIGMDYAQQRGFFCQ